MSVPKGQRYGGKPKGYKHQKTLEKEAARELTRQIITAHLEPMTLAQIAHAKGIAYIVLRNPDGTFTRATNEAQVDAACAAGAEAFKIFTQAPNTQAYTDLMNRALDKPAEQLQVQMSGALELQMGDRLRAARARLAKAKA